MTKLKDSIWLWGQNVGSHHTPDRGNVHNLPGENKMDSAECCRRWGVNKCCRVAMVGGPFPPFDSESEKLKHLKEVVWSAIGAGGVFQHNNDESDLPEVLRQAQKYDNISGAVLDDFFRSVEGFEIGKGSIARHSLDSIKSMRDKLHNFSKRKLDLWLVWYSYQLDYDILDYVDLCDVITLWTWKGYDLEFLDENMEKFINKTPGKRRLAGCYMWNYGEHKPLAIEQMRSQLDCCHKRLKRGELEGIILCSNCIGDLGLDTVKYTLEWLKEHGEENILSAETERKKKR